MAEHHIRRWFQFGILDLLIVTTLVGLGAMLARPVDSKANKAPPWLCGFWEGGGGTLVLYPDGFFRTYGLLGSAEGLGWQVKRIGESADGFALECGASRFVVKSEWGSGVIDLLGAAGQVHIQLKENGHFEGPLRDGRPHGTWPQRLRGGPLLQLDYRDGELVGFRRNRQRSLGDLNALRKLRGLPDMSERDFPDEIHPKRKTP